jgi:hypothetical protein
MLFAPNMTVMSFTRAATLDLLVLVMVLVWPRPVASAPVPVRFVQDSNTAIEAELDPTAIDA